MPGTDNGGHSGRVSPVLSAHGGDGGAGGAGRPAPNKEVKLDELSKYFHLPEKAVAKELGICLTSLKKLCRSYGITRWPFRKLKSLERTMRKVQTESEVINCGGALDVAGTGKGGAAVPGGGAAAGAEVKRRPYTVGNRTVFLSDEELEVFKMTLGKEAPSQLKPTMLSSLEPALLSNASLSAASAALANVARLVPYRSGEADESPAISAQVVGTSLVIVNWSTLWSQPQLKGKLLVPLGGTALKVSPEGISAELLFEDEETAKRALRICKLAELQAVSNNNASYSGAPGSTGGGAAEGDFGQGANGSVAHVLGQHQLPLQHEEQQQLQGAPHAQHVQHPQTAIMQGMWSSILSSALLPPGTSGAEAASAGAHASANGHVNVHAATSASTPAAPPGESGAQAPQSLIAHLQLAYPHHAHMHAGMMHPGMHPMQQPLSFISGLMADGSTGPTSVGPMGVGPMSHMHPNLAANMPANMAANMGPMSHWHGMPIMPGSIPPGSFSQMSHMPMPHSFGGMAMAGMAGPMAGPQSGMGMGMGMMGMGPMGMGPPSGPSAPPPASAALAKENSTSSAEFQQPQSSQVGVPLTAPISSLFPGMFSQPVSQATGAPDSTGAAGILGLPLPPESSQPTNLSPPDSLSSFMAK